MGVVLMRYRSRKHLGVADVSAPPRLWLDLTVLISGRLSSFPFIGRIPSSDCETYDFQVPTLSAQSKQTINVANVAAYLPYEAHITALR